MRCAWDQSQRRAREKATVTRRQVSDGDLEKKKHGQDSRYAGRTWRQAVQGPIDLDGFSSTNQSCWNVVGHMGEGEASSTTSDEGRSKTHHARTHELIRRFAGQVLRTVTAVDGTLHDACAYGAYVTVARMPVMDLSDRAAGP